MDRAGVPTYDELVLVANEDALDRDGRKLRASSARSRAARAALQRDPDRAIEGSAEGQPDLDPKLQRASLKATLPLFAPPAGKPYG